MLPQSSPPSPSPSRRFTRPFDILELTTTTTPTTPATLRNTSSPWKKNPTLTTHATTPFKSLNKLVSTTTSSSSSSSSSSSLMTSILHTPTLVQTIKKPSAFTLNPSLYTTSPSHGFSPVPLTSTSNPSTPFTLHRRRFPSSMVPSDPVHDHHGLLPTTFYPPSTPKRKELSTLSQEVLYVTKESPSLLDSTPKEDALEKQTQTEATNSSVSKSSTHSDLLHSMKQTEPLILVGNLKVQVDESQDIDTLTTKKKRNRNEALNHSINNTLTFPLYSGHNIIGYNPGFLYGEERVPYLQKKITVELNGISKKHASLYILESGIVFLRDLSSANGTFLNVSSSTRTSSTSSSSLTEFQLPPNLYFQLLPPFQFRLSQYTCQVCLDYLSFKSTPSLSPSSLPTQPIVDPASVPSSPTSNFLSNPMIPATPPPPPLPSSFQPPPKSCSPSPSPSPSSSSASTSLIRKTPSRYFTKPIHSNVSPSSPLSHRLKRKRLFSPSATHMKSPSKRSTPSSSLKGKKIDLNMFLPKRTTPRLKRSCSLDKKDEKHEGKDQAEQEEVDEEEEEEAEDERIARFFTKD